MKLKSEYLLDGAHLDDERKLHWKQHEKLMHIYKDDVTSLGLRDDAQPQYNTYTGWDMAQTSVVEDEPFDDDESTDVSSEVGPTHSEGETLETYDETPAPPVHEECDIQFIEVKCI